MLICFKSPREQGQDEKLSYKLEGLSKNNYFCMNRGNAA